MTAQPRPLSDLRIIECATFVAGPSSGLALATLGADVIRVDLPGGGSDANRWPLSAAGGSLYWLNLNKAKRSVAIDYRTPQGRELLISLVAMPGPGNGFYVDNVVGRHRLRHQELSAARADVITVHIEGFADGRPAVDYTANASVGIATMTGPATTQEPVNHVLPAWDLLTGLHSAVSILSAARRRDQVGVGAKIELALYDVALSAVGTLGWLEEARQSNGPRERHGNHVFGSFGTDFRTADGQRVMVVALTEGQWDALCSVTGTGPVFSALQTALDVDLHEESQRYQLRETVASILRPWFASRTLDELSLILDRARVLWGPYRSVLEAAQEAGNDPAGIGRVVDQPGVGPMLTTTLPMRLDGASLDIAAAPVIGADTESVLVDLLSLSSAEVGRLIDNRVVAAVDG